MCGISEEHLPLVHLALMLGPSSAALGYKPLWLRAYLAGLFCIIRMLELVRNLKGHLVQPSLFTDKEVK